MFVNAQVWLELHPLYVLAPPFLFQASAAVRHLSLPEDNVFDITNVDCKVTAGIITGLGEYTQNSLS